MNKQLKIFVFIMKKEGLIINMKKLNVCCGSVSAYHLESQTRHQELSHEDIHMMVDLYNKKKNLIDKVFKSGHLSTSEHAYFTFAIEGISRACSHQLVRHRHCSFSQQSQRYVEIKEDLDDLKRLKESQDYERQVYQLLLQHKRSWFEILFHSDKHILHNHQQSVLYYQQTDQFYFF